MVEKKTVVWGAVAVAVIAILFGVVYQQFAVRKTATENTPGWGMNRQAETPSVPNGYNGTGLKQPSADANAAVFVPIPSGDVSVDDVTKGISADMTGDATVLDNEAKGETTTLDSSAAKANDLGNAYDQSSL